MGRHDHPIGSRPAPRRAPPNRIYLRSPSDVPTTQLPVIEWDAQNRQWRIWLSYPRNFTGGGTYLVLSNTGAAYRIIEDPDGTVASHNQIYSPNRAV